MQLPVQFGHFPVNKYIYMYTIKVTSKRFQDHLLHCSKSVNQSISQLINLWHVSPPDMIIQYVLFGVLKSFILQEHTPINPSTLWKLTYLELLLPSLLLNLYDFLFICLNWVFLGSVHYFSNQSAINLINHIGSSLGKSIIILLDI